jgi:hypothetical protein
MYENIQINQRTQISRGKGKINLQVVSRSYYSYSHGLEYETKGIYEL